MNEPKPRTTLILEMTDEQISETRNKFFALLVDAREAGVFGSLFAQVHPEYGEMRVVYLDNEESMGIREVTRATLHHYIPEKTRRTGTQREPIARPPMRRQTWFVSERDATLTTEEWEARKAALTPTEQAEIDDIAGMLAALRAENPAAKMPPHPMHVWVMERWHGHAWDFHEEAYVPDDATAQALTELALEMQ